MNRVSATRDLVMNRFHADIDPMSDHVAIVHSMHDICPC